jgi:DNA polymerase III subunit delta
MAHTLATFQKQLAGPDLKPAYLIAGEEHLLVLEAADALRARARALGFNEREVLDAETHFDWDALARAGASMSLFASRRLIDMRLPTGKPGKEGSDAIVDYCENPPPDTVLMIVANQWSKQQQAGAWVNAIERVGMVIPVWPLKPDELPDWIGQRMASRGLKPDRAAIEALADRVEGNSLAAAQEIDKLALLHGSKPLDADTLEQLVTDSARFDVFKLVDAALEGDAARTIRVLHGLRAEGEQVPALMGWVLNQLQLIARLASNSNLSSAFRNEHIWPARERVYRQALSRADRAHWEKCLIQAARVDRLSKGRGWGDPWRELERLLAAVAMPRAKLLAAS